MDLRVLIILKRRQDSVGKTNNISLSTGLYNSANYINDLLHEKNIKVKTVVVTDNNDIDREVTKYKPTHVIIEALWVVPTKFEILHKLHPSVNWIIRIHSQIPFISNEGIAMDWIGEYMKCKNVFVAANAIEAYKDVKYYVKKELGVKNTNRIIYLPNYYPLNDFKKKKKKNKNDDKECINISCFGAIRPMKNHLEQAFAAIKFADLIGKKLKFHINVGRIEKGDSVLKNIESLFSHIDDVEYELVEHEWLPREDFLKLCSKMDLGLQCSFSETFNIVAADLISSGVPVVGTTEIPWLTKIFTAKATKTNSIIFNLLKSYIFSKLNVYINRIKLKKYSNKSKRVWLKYLKNETNDKNKILLNR